MGGSACVSTLACTSSRAEISCDLLECAAYRSLRRNRERGEGGADMFLRPPFWPLENHFTVVEEP